MEVEYVPGHLTGGMTLRVGGTVKQSFTTLDNDGSKVDTVRLGAQGVDTGTRGTVYFDDFASRRFSTIGLLNDPNKPDLLFANDWETGTLSAWTSSVTDGGNLSAQAAAMYIGSYGLQAVVNDNNDLYVQDDTPAAEKHYLTRFYVKPNSLTMASGDILDLFTGYSGTSSPVVVFRVQMQKTGNTYQVRVGLRNTAGTWTDSSWYDLNNRWNAVEVEWMASSTGSLGLWVNGESQQTINYVDNNSLAIDSVRLGAMGVDTGTRGTLSFDDFVSHRYTAVGLAYRSGQTNAAYTYADDDHVHAVTSVDRGASTDTYVYDENGNMTCRVEGDQTYNQFYNAENRMTVAQLLRTGVDCPAANSLALTSNTLAAWQFVYDGDGTRVKQLYTEYDENGAPTSAVATYLVAGGTYEVQIGAQMTVKLYYAIPGQVVAMRTTTESGSELNYFLTDHLGSAVAITDASGALVSEQRYLPFGQVREDVGIAVTQTDFGYPFQRNNSYIKLMDFRSRWYADGLARFSQPDSIVPNLYNPQSLNRYAYVNNSPVNFTDPTGHNPMCGPDGDMCEKNCNDDGRGYCGHGGITVLALQNVLIRYDVMLTGDNRDIANAYAVYIGVTQVASALGDVSTQPSILAFKNAFDPIKVSIGNTNGWLMTGSYSGGYGAMTIKSGWTATPRQIAHELAHVLAKQLWAYYGGQFASTNNPVELLGNGIYTTGGQLVTITGNRHNGKSAPENGYYGDYAEWQWHGVHLDEGNTPDEDWADIFMNWAFDSFYPNPGGEALYTWTSTHMQSWMISQH